MSSLFHTLRVTLLVEVDELIPDGTGLYTAYRLPDSEAVAILDRDPAAVIKTLKQQGYDYNNLSAAKLHPSEDKTSIGSYRRVPTTHPELTDYDARLTDEWTPQECQYHVHLFEYERGTALFSHYELRPDLFEPSFSPSRLDAHYKPDWGEEYLQGVVDPRLRGLLDYAGTEF